MEYMDSNGDYIIFKETIEEFIDNILTLNKNSDIYKDILINKNHEFYIDYPILGWNNSVFGFDLDVVDISKITLVDNKIKLKNETVDANWAGEGAVGSNNYILNNAFNTVDEYFINNINGNTIKLDNGNDSIISPSLSFSGSIYTDISSRIKLSIVSKIFKQIQNDTETEVINIQNISNIRVKINVIAEDKIVINTYTYIIQI
jgi:hypothetical protein